MSTNNVNIVIPAITLGNELIFCLKKLNNLNFKNFQVTIVLDFDNKKKISFTNYKVNKIIVGKKNMSEKRKSSDRRYDDRRCDERRAKSVDVLEDRRDGDDRRQNERRSKADRRS